MLYTFGRLFFPTMIHQEKKLRARMILVSAISGLVLAVGISVLLVHVYQTRRHSEKTFKPPKSQTVSPAR